MPKHLPPAKTDEDVEEERLYLDMLRRNGRLIESEREDVPLPPGVTHVLVKTPDQPPRLVRRKMT